MWMCGWAKFDYIELVHIVVDQELKNDSRDSILYSYLAVLNANMKVSIYIRCMNIIICEKVFDSL